MLSSFKVSTVALKGSQVSITLTPLTTQVSKQTHQRSMVMSEDHLGGYRMALCHEIPMCIPIKPLCSCVCIFKLTSHIIYGKSKLQHFFLFVFFFTNPSFFVPQLFCACHWLCLPLHLCIVSVWPHGEFSLPFWHQPSQFTFDFQRVQLLVQLNLTLGTNKQHKKLHF